jgi:methyl-accepting chemotaxis protein
MDRPKGIRSADQEVERVSTITQQNAASAEETASAAEELASQAAQMIEVVDGFKLRGGDAASLARVSSPPTVALGKRAPVQGALPS